MWVWRAATAAAYSKETPPPSTNNAWSRMRKERTWGFKYCAHITCVQRRRAPAGSSHAARRTGPTRRNAINQEPSRYTSWIMRNATPQQGRIPPCVPLGHLPRLGGTWGARYAGGGLPRERLHRMRARSVRPHAPKINQPRARRGAYRVELYLCGVV